MRKTAVLAAGILLVTSLSAFAVVGGGDVMMKAGKAGDVTFSHEAHVNGVGLECTACHADLYTSSKQHKKTTMKEMQKGKSCGACHNGKKAFSVKDNCSNCHKK